MISLLDGVAAASAAVAAGVINAVAGGGTLVSFPTLVALGVPAVSANITNTVSLCPGYLGGAYAQRSDLTRHAGRLRLLLVVAAAGGLCGSVLLVLSSERLFRSLVPYLILLSCALLAFQDVIKRFVGAPGGGEEGRHHRVALAVAVFGAATYGGYFGAGLGIMLLAVLGLALDDSLNRLNALKQALSLVINVCAAAFFVFSGKVYWEYAAVMAVGSFIGGNVGGRIAGRLNPKVMRAVVVSLGVAVAVRLLV